MSIRDIQGDDVLRLRQIFTKSNLPENCMPNLNDPLVLVKKIVEEESGNVAMAAVVKMISEAYLLVDHTVGDAPWRWTTLRELTENVCTEAKSAGIDSISCWLPPEIDRSFGRRLETLGFFKSPWQSYSRNLTE